jgi:hypothetical protein
MRVPNQGFLAQSIRNVTVLKKIMRMVHVRFSPKNLVGYAEGLAPQASAAFDVFFFDVSRQVFE